jgi:hypothetical protein
MEAYLKARSWKPVGHEQWDRKDYEEWYHDADDPGNLLLISIWTGLFDENSQLRLYTASEWKPKLIERKTILRATGEVDPDEIPF